MAEGVGLADSQGIALYFPDLSDSGDLLQSIFIGTKPSLLFEDRVEEGAFGRMGEPAAPLPDDLDEPILVREAGALLEVRSIVAALGMGEAPLLDILDEPILVREAGALVLLEVRVSVGAFERAREVLLLLVVLEEAALLRLAGAFASLEVRGPVDALLRPLLFAPLLFRDGSCAFLVAPSSDTADLFANNGGWAATDAG